MPQLVSALQSVRSTVLPLEWGSTEVPSATLTTVDVGAPLDTGAYLTRDRELAYRDNVVWAKAIDLARRFNETFGASLSIPSLPASPAGELENSTQDTSTQVLPGSVTHVDNSGVPLDAVDVDRQLYARDVLLHDMLALSGEILEPNPLAPVGDVERGDAWSKADGSEGEDVSEGRSYSTNLFREADRGLADRDNKVATFVATLSNACTDLYEHATRLVVVLDGQPEVFVFLDDDSNTRTFITEPTIFGHRVEYNRLTRTLRVFQDEGDVGEPEAYAGQTETDSLSITGNSTVNRFASFWAEKSGALQLTPFTRTLVADFTEPVSVTDLNLSGPTAVSPGLLFTNNGHYADFPIPGTPGDGEYTIALCTEYTKNLVLPASLTGSPTLLPGEEASWSIDIVPGTYALSFTYEAGAVGDIFEGRVVWEKVGGGSSLLFDGIFPGTGGVQRTTSAIVFETETTGSIRFLRRDTLDTPFALVSANVLNYSTTPVSCRLTVEAGDEAKTLDLASVVGSLATISTEHAGSLSTVRVRVDSISGGALYLSRLAVGQWNGVRSRKPIGSKAQWKRTYLDRALSSISSAFSRTSGTLPLEWSSAATTNWRNRIEAGGENLGTVLRTATPLDTGRPALVPRGLTPSGSVGDAYPTLQSFQPWMLALNIPVFADSFVSLSRKP